MRNGERVDLAREKEQLSRALGSHSNRYWEIFRDFIQAKLSKPEFDLAARRILTENNLVLHNQFVLSILHNARSPRPPPDYLKQALQSPMKTIDKRKTKTQEAPGRKKRVNPAEVQPYSVLKRKGLSGVIRIQHIPNDEVEGSSVPTMSPLDEQLVTDPEQFALRQKMKRTANEVSVVEVSNDSVGCMKTALEIQLKRIIALCIEEKKGQTRKINKEDMYHVILNNPAFFSNTGSIDQERALLLLE